MAIIVEQLLHLSRPRTGSRESVSLADVISRASVLLDNQLTAAGIDVHRHLPQTLPNVFATTAAIQ